MRKTRSMIALSIAAVCAFGYMLSNGPKTVEKAVREDVFQEFYYTYATTVYPPEFRRYRIYTENGKKLFYHETREGDTVFLTEEDITVSGEMELTPAEWETLWGCLSGGHRGESQGEHDHGPHPPVALSVLERRQGQVSGVHLCGRGKGSRI